MSILVWWFSSFFFFSSGWHLSSSDIVAVVVFFSFSLDEVKMRDWSTGMMKRRAGGERWELRRPPSSAPRWPSPSSRTPSCFPDRAVRPGCWLGCWGLARPATTGWR